MAKARNPLEPLATVTGILVWSVAALFAFVLAMTVFGSGSVMGIGRDTSVCIDIPRIAGVEITPTAEYTPRAGVAVNRTGVRLCQASPTGRQLAWQAVLWLPEALLLFGSLFLLHRLLRHAQRDGIFTPGTARRVEWLGWFLVAGSLLQFFLEPFVSQALLDTLVTGSGPYRGSSPYSIDWAVALAGVAALSFARILRVGADMYDDLAGTV